MGFTLDACAPRTAARPQAAPRRPPLVLPPVKVSWDRVLRTTVGLRPHRPSGFVLRADKLDAKTLIHNFGHGGSGMSLSWGTASMAADLALAHPDRRAAVLGSGVVGLTSARELQRRGFEVTIYAASLPPDTTSNMSLAGWTPTSGLVDTQLRTPEWDEQCRQAAAIAYRRLQLLAGPRYGVTWIVNYSPTETPQPQQNPNPLLPPSLLGSRDILQPGEHPFPTTFCVASSMMRIEPSIYLDALMADFLDFGGKVVVRRFETPRDVAQLAEPLVVNCTGLGSKALFGDPDLVPLKGQLVALVPQPDITYATNGGAKPQPPGPGAFIHMMPRRDGIILGGTSQRDVWTLEPDDTERKRVVEAHMELFASMRGAAALT